MLNNLQGTKVAVINFPALWERCKLELLKQKQFQEWKAGPEFTALTNQLVEAKKAFEDYKRVIGNAPLTTRGGGMFLFSTPEGREHDGLQSTVQRYERGIANTSQQKLEAIHQNIQTELRAALIKYATAQNISILLNHTDTFFHVNENLDITNAFVAFYNA
jgi:Outer membrane protein (OmpH-like)